MISDFRLDHLLEGILQARICMLQNAVSLRQLENWLFLMGFEQEEGLVVVSSISRLKDQNKVAYTRDMKIYWTGE